MGYWGRVAKRALVEARAEVRLDTPVRIVTGVIVPIAAGLAGGFLTGNIAWGSIVGVGLLSLVGLTVFLSKMFSVPAELDNERMAELGNLETKFAERDDKDRIARQLMIFVDEGKAYQRRIPTAEHPSTVEIKQWIKGVRNFIKSNIGYAMAFKFGDDTGLDMAPNKSIMSLPSPRAPKDFALLDRRIKRLGEIIEKFA